LDVIQKKLNYNQTYISTVQNKIIYWSWSTSYRRIISGRSGHEKICKYLTKPVVIVSAGTMSASAIIHPLIIESHLEWQAVFTSAVGPPLLV